MLAVQIESTKPNWRDRIAERWRTARHGFRRRGSIRFDDAGLTCTAFQADGSAQSVHLKWSEVNGVVAYKRDAVTVDLICVGFTTSDGTLEVNEEMDGWTPLAEALPKHLPGTPSKAEWWDKVAHPAFATNATVLFSQR